MADYYDIHGKNKPKFSGAKLALVALVVILVLALRTLVALKLDYTWFENLGYANIFWRTFSARLLFGVGVFLAAALLNYFNILIIERVAGKSVKKLLALVISLFAAVIVVGGSAGLWLEYLKYVNSQSFGISDPQFGLDIAFYAFKLPFLWVIYRLVNIWLIVNLLISIPLYLLLTPKSDMEVSVKEVTVRILSGAEKRGLGHIGVLLGLLLGWQAVQYKLSTYELLYSQLGSVIGAGATDIGARLPGYLIMMGVSLLIGIFIALIFAKKIRLALLGIVVYLVLAVLITGVYPGLYQRFSVDPDELGRESPYLERNIHYTNLAYGLDNITEQEYPVGELTAQDISANREIIDNIRLLDHGATKSTYGQQQEIRLYYDFVDVDVDRYVIDGKLTQVMLSARELNRQSLPEQARTFNNLLFKYTHGFGLVMSPANAVSEAGLPQYLIKDIPPQSSGVQVTEPRIYFGEATKDNVIVSSGLKEFDYPQGDNNAEYDYQGKNGIPLTFLNKILITFRDGQIKYLLSDYIKPSSQYLETRDIKDRVNRIAPFLIYDQDPYLVLGKDGKLYYLLDAYTYTDKYPYSQAVESGSFNYLRNSVKIVLDAYTGQVNFYIFDQKDPLIKAYAAIYPGLFQDATAFPADLQEHIRYPEDLFTVQSNMLRDYHMSNPTVFYNREDRWELAQVTQEGKSKPQEAYYSIIRLPGEKSQEFVLMRVFTPSGKQNAVGWLAGRSDGQNYGKLLLYKFPKGVQVAGTVQVESLIDQDPVISGQLTLWGQGGSKVIRGNLLVYPINGSLLYVEPLYIESEQNKFPQLKKVFVGYKDKVVMEDTLEKALTSIFGGNVQQTKPGTPPTVSENAGSETTQELIKRLVSLYKEAQEKIKAGDWAGYGQLQQELNNIVGQLEAGTK